MFGLWRASVSRNASQIKDVHGRDKPRHAAAGRSRTAHFGITGLNDVLNMSNILGFCETCHDMPNVGNHSVKTPLNIGIAMPDPTSHLPSTFPACWSSRSDAQPVRSRVRIVSSPIRGAR